MWRFFPQTVADLATSVYAFYEKNSVFLQPELLMTKKIKGYELF